jgi:hypothetical protein
MKNQLVSKNNTYLSILANNDLTMPEQDGKLFFMDKSQDLRETYISDILP